jgi:tetratricopeptide (TPR) repeat protein
MLRSLSLSARRALNALIGQHRYAKLKDAARRAIAAVSHDHAALAQRAQLAWDNGDGPEAMRDWERVIRAQPRNPDWPLKLALATEIYTDSFAAERIVQDAWARGARSGDLAERIAFYKRWNRNSNSAEDDAVAAIRDPASVPNMVSRAVGFLLALGRLDEAREGLARMLADPNAGSVARSHAAALAILDKAKREGRSIVNGWLSPAHDAVLVREPGCDTTVIGFTTLRGDGGMPVNAIHALFQPAKVNAIYLFDEQRTFNLSGSTRFGRPYGAMIEGLRAQLDQWGTHTLIMFGFSGPGYTALRAGLDLNADGALLVSPVVTLNRRPEFDIAMARGRAGDDSRLLFLEKYMRATVPQMMINLHDELATRTALKTIDIHYGTNLTDLVHINEIWDLKDSIELHQIDFPKHEVLSEIVQRGDFDVATRFVEKVRAAQARG